MSGTIRTLPVMSETLNGYARCSSGAQDLTAQRDRLSKLGVPEQPIYLDHGLTIAAPPARAALAQHWPEVGLILPRLGTMIPSADEAEIGVRLFRSVSGFVRELATEHPLVLVIDDIHWADSGTPALLTFLSAHLGDARVLIVATFRDDDAIDSSELQAMLAGVARERRLWEVTLRGLDQESTAALIKARAGSFHVSDDVTTLLHERSGGNPFFAEELVQACLEQHQGTSGTGSLELASVRALEIPRGVRATIRQRIERLPADARDLLATASVLGVEFGPRLLGHVAELSEDLVLQQLAAPVEARLLSESADTQADTYAFRHALIQEALYAGLPRHQRRVLHRRAGEVLETLQPDSTAELARHFRAGGDYERAIHYSREAGLQAARQGAYAEAAAHLRTAVSLFDENSAPARKAELLRLLGAQLERVSRDEALDIYQECLRLFRDVGDRAGQARVQRDVAWLYGNRQDFPTALTYLNQAMTSWPTDRQDADYVRLLVDHARMRAFVLDLDRAGSLARRGLKLAEEMSDAGLLARG